MTNRARAFMAEWWSAARQTVLTAQLANVLIGALLGAGLSMATMAYRDHASFQRERQHGFSWLDQEISQNDTRIRDNLKCIKEARRKGYKTFPAVAMSPLSTDGLLFVVSRLGPRALASGDDFLALATLYGNLRFLNVQVERRDAFRVNKMGEANFMMNLDAFDKVLELLSKEAMKQLDICRGIVSQQK